MKKSWVLILTSFVLSASGATAAPLCARTLLHAPSQQEIAATVSSLAELKMRLDFLKTQSAFSQEHRILGKQYSIKLTELETVLVEKYSPKSIQEMIAREIAKSHEIKISEKQKEIKDRRSERVLLNLDYQKTKTLKLRHESDGTFFEYLPEKEVVLYLTYLRDELRSKNIKTGAETVLFKIPNHDYQRDLNVVLSPDRQNLILNNQNGEISTFNISTKVSSPLKRTVKKRFSKMVLDSKGEVLFLANMDQIVAYDLTKQTQKIIDIENSTALPIVLDAHQVLLNRSGKLSILNVQSGKENEIDFQFPDAHISVISDDGMTLAISRNHRIETLDLSHLKEHKENNPHFYERNFSYFNKLSGFNYVLASHTDFYRTQTYAIFKISDLMAPMFEFAEYSAQSGHKDQGPLEFKFAPDLESTAVLYNAGDVKSRGTTIHIWEIPK